MYKLINEIRVKWHTHLSISVPMTFNNYRALYDLNSVYSCLKGKMLSTKTVYFCCEDAHFNMRGLWRLSHFWSTPKMVIRGLEGFNSKVTFPSPS